MIVYMNDGSTKSLDENDIAFKIMDAIVPHLKTLKNDAIFVNLIAMFPDGVPKILNLIRPSSFNVLAEKIEEFIPTIGSDNNDDWCISSFSVRCYPTGIEVLLYLCTDDSVSYRF